MKKDEYLQRVLAEQTFGSADQEVKDLRQRRKDIEKLLRKDFAESSVSICWGGAMAKGTMIRESYDGDMTCYFASGDTGPGKTLSEIYDKVAAALDEKYLVHRKTSALRVKDKSAVSHGRDFHIDVVPGRYTDDNKTDVFLHQNQGAKERLKTNLDVHIAHVKDSGVVDAIRLLKLWNVRNGVGAKTFVLELLAAKLLKVKKNKSISDQLVHVWTKFRDETENLAVEDPANPSGNDLKPALDACRWSLSAVASTTLANIDSKGWETVFGPLKGEDDTNEAKASAIRAAVIRAAVPTRPWCKSA